MHFYNTITLHKNPFDISTMTEIPRNKIHEFNLKR